MNKSNQRLNRYYGYLGEALTVFGGVALAMPVAADKSTHIIWYSLALGMILIKQYYKTRRI